MPSDTRVRTCSGNERRAGSRADRRTHDRHRIAVVCRHEDWRLATPWHRQRTTASPDQSTARVDAQFSSWCGPASQNTDRHRKCSKRRYWRALWSLGFPSLIHINKDLSLRVHDARSAMFEGVIQPIRALQTEPIGIPWADDVIQNFQDSAGSGARERPDRLWFS